MGSTFKKFWWGIFFGALVGAQLLAPDSGFSYRVREFLYTLQDSVVATLDAMPTITFETALNSLVIFIVICGLFHMAASISLFIYFISVRRSSINDALANSGIEPTFYKAIYPLAATFAVLKC